MTDATTKTEVTKSATFNVVGQFAKDISLECPLPPFAKEAENLKMQMDVGIGVRSLDGNEGHHEVSLKLRAESKNEAEETCYLAEVEYAGVFLLKNFPEEQITPLLSIDGAALIFPFARQILTQLICDAGYRSPVIAPVNFHAMYSQAQQQQKSEKAS
ncbi:MAG: preprotein translocase subunit SecB [Alphaproteobacteria bacterium]|jgi:preprotein translocase subunit SecB